MSSALLRHSTDRPRGAETPDLGLPQTHQGLTGLPVGLVGCVSPAEPTTLSVRMARLLTRKRPLATGSAGFTLFELAIVVGMIGTMLAFAVPATADYVQGGRIARAMGEIRLIQIELSSIDTLPDDLGVIGRATMIDPWGNAYVYQKFVFPPGIAAQARKDRFLVPINSQYDLYSMGKDGDTRLPLTVPKSRDDVIRANDGSFIGLAASY